jgi:predicted phage terminase large subunit-like protein
MVVLPRTWFKSTIGSIAYPIWRAINDPDIRVLIAQNTMTNAKKKVGAIKNIFENNELLRALFPEILPTGSNPWSSECLMLRRKLSSPEGTFEPAGTGTAVTSRHYDIIIEDDTVAPDFDAMTGEIQQPTQLEIEKAIGFHKLCHPLLIHPTKSQIVIIGTRWAPEDLIGWIIEHSPGYKIMTRAALEKNGLPADESQGGQPVWDRFDWDTIKELKASVGLFMFHMLYLNIATSAINQIFKRSQVSYYERLPSDLLYCTSVDPAPSDSEATTIDADYNVVLTTAVNPRTGDIYVVNYNRDRVDPGELIDIIFRHYNAYKPLEVRVETVAYQKTLSYWITQRQNALKKRFYINEMKNAKSSKAARIMALQPWFAAGKVHMRADHTDLERELLSFDPAKKSGIHDDVIDALSMQVGFWSDVIDAQHEQEKMERRADPFSAESIVDELIQRNKKMNRYPYDIGIMSDRMEVMYN